MNHHQAHPNKDQTPLTQRQSAQVSSTEKLFFALFGIEIPAFFAIPDFPKILQNKTYNKNNPADK